MKFSEAFSGLTAKNVVGLFIFASGCLVVGRPVLLFIGQVFTLAGNALPTVFK